MRRPTPNASGVIFNPGAACLRLYSLRSTFRRMSSTSDLSKPLAEMALIFKPSSM